MTVRFRLDRLRLETTGGSVIYDFGSDLTVLAGDTGVGKSTLLELIKFGLGGEALLAPVALNDVSEVQLDVRVGLSRLNLSRSVATENRRVVRVIDMESGARLPDVTTDISSSRPESGPSSLSDLLMTSLGFPTDMPAAARGGGSTRKGSRITFNDLLRYMYVPQSAINRDVAGSSDSYYDPKRKAVFEFLFGLTEPEVLEKQSRINDLRGKIQTARKEHSLVRDFLLTTQPGGRVQALAQQVDAERAQEAARWTVDSLRDEIESHVDRETQTLRDLLSGSERELAEARQITGRLSREAQGYENERRRLEQDISRLDRQADAGRRLADFEFVMCPRCTQDLTRREVPADHCPVCVQPDVVPARTGAVYERLQLSEQLAELREQEKITQGQADQARDAEAGRARFIATLSAQIDERTRDRVTPRLQAYADAFAAIERHAALQSQAEHSLQQWDRVDDLDLAASDLETEKNRLQTEVASAASRLSARKLEVLRELNDEFQETVTAFGIPAGQSATIDDDSYLPLLGGLPLSKVTLAGGIATSTQVAYWLTLMTVAARRRDTRYPTMLVLDSPRLALNSAEDIAAQMYKRFVAQVDVTRGRLQFIVADNELPADYAGEFGELDFDYDHPTVGTVRHPGRAHVEPIMSSEGT